MEDGKSRTEEAITARLTGQVENKLGACKKCGYGAHLRTFSSSESALHRHF